MSLRLEEISRVWNEENGKRVERERKKEFFFSYKFLLINPPCLSSTITTLEHGMPRPKHWRARITRSSTAMKSRLFVQQQLVPRNCIDELVNKFYIHASYHVVQSNVSYISICAMCNVWFSTTVSRKRWIVAREQGAIHFRAKATIANRGNWIFESECWKARRVIVTRDYARYRWCVVEIFPARLRKVNPWIRPTHLAPNFNRVNV